MLQEKLTNLSLEHFQTKLAGKKLAIVYPQNKNRNYYLAYYMSLDSRQLVYYRLDADEDTITKMLEGFASQWEGFENTQKAIQKATAQSLAETFAKDIAALKQDCLIYLDELDHLNRSEEYRSFFTTLINQLPDNCQIVINARLLTTEPWRQFILDGSAVVLGTEQATNELMFSRENADKPQLEVYGFGRGHAFVNGLEIEQWDGILPRQLFFYFVDKPLITRDEIFEIFWAKLNIKDATNVYHVTKRKINEKISENVLGGGDFDLTNYSEGFYRPSDSLARHYDVAQFEAAIEEASMTFDEDKQASLYQQAVNLYTAPFLLTIDMDWVYERREKLQRLFLEALIELARYHKNGKRYELSLGYFARALRENLYREDLHREVMRLYVALNFPQEALRQYALLASQLKDGLGVEPAPETQALFLEIKG